MAWVSLAVYRMIQPGGGRFALLALLGLFYACLTAFIAVSGDTPVRTALDALAPAPPRGAHAASRRRKTA
jgi:hypothetical protein